MPKGVYKRKEFSDDHKMKISIALKNHTVTEETRNKIRRYQKENAFWKGRHITEDVKNKIRIKKIGEKKSEETKHRMSLANQGAKSHFWRGGVTPLTQRRLCTAKWIEIRKEVYKRDNWHCQICGKHCYKNIQCHHIIPYRISHDDSTPNLITLCKSCHIKEENKYYHSLKQLILFNK